MDNCDPTARVSFIDAFVPGSCNEGTINRTWTAIDTCGNIMSLLQTITVIDTVGPTITVQAMDSVFQCSGGTNVDTAFISWIDSIGGAMAMDNCSDPINFTVLPLNTGTSDLTTLPDSICGMGDTLRIRTVDFVVFDECGLTDTTLSLIHI